MKKIGYHSSLHNRKLARNHNLEVLSPLVLVLEREYGSRSPCNAPPHPGRAPILWVGRIAARDLSGCLFRMLPMDDWWIGQSAAPSFGSIS